MNPAMFQESRPRLLLVGECLCLVCGREVLASVHSIIQLRSSCQMRLHARLMDLRLVLSRLAGGSERELMGAEANAHE